MHTSCPHKSRTKHVLHMREQKRHPVQTQHNTTKAVLRMCIAMRILPSWYITAC